MYGIPTDFPFVDLKNAELQQICFGENDVIINFTGDISVLVTSEIEICSAKIIRSEDFKFLSAQLLGLIGSKIIKACSKNNKDIEIEFSNGTIITIIDNSKIFESYIISFGCRRYII